MGIFSLVLLGVYSLLTFALRWQNKMQDSVEVYQRAFKVSSRLGYDLGTGSQSSFIYDAYGLAFASARPDTGTFQIDPSGQLMWQRYVFYYVDSNGDMYRNEEAFAPTTSPPTPDLTTLKAAMTSPGQLVAKNVSGLQIVPGSGVSIRLTVSGDDPLKPNTMTMENRVTFRQ